MGARRSSTLKAGRILTLKVVRSSTLDLLVMGVSGGPCGAWWFTVVHGSLLVFAGGGY